MPITPNKFSLYILHWTMWHFQTPYQVIILPRRSNITIQTYTNKRVIYSVFNINSHYWLYISGKAVKHCTLNGTWFRKENLEWTDYTRCLDKEVSLIDTHWYDNSSASVVLVLHLWWNNFKNFDFVEIQTYSSTSCNFLFNLNVCKMFNLKT